MLLTIAHTFEDIFTAVKQESSLFAIRQVDKEGSPLFETLVFDEAYLPKFRELFLNAQAQVVPCLAAYMQGPQRDWFDRDDMMSGKDFTCQLYMPDDFNRFMARPIEDYIFSFLRDWIMYKWLETKNPETAATYLSNCIGPDGYRDKILRALNSRSRVVRRWHGYY